MHHNRPITKISIGDAAKAHSGKMGHIYFRGPVVIRLTCDCAVADDAVMPIRAESGS